MTVFLSPSHKKYRTSPTTGKSETEVMEHFSQSIEKALIEMGVNVLKSSNESSPKKAVNEAAKEKSILYLALSPLKTFDKGKQGIEIYYSSSNARSRDIAKILSRNFKNIYYDESLVKEIPNFSFIELTEISSPSLILCLGNLLNSKDESWFLENESKISTIIADTLAHAVCLQCSSENSNNKTGK